MKFEYVFFAIFALVAANMLRKVVQNGGFRGALFGAPIRTTVSEIELHGRGMVKSRLKVHTLAGDSGAPQVGVEIAHSSVVSWQMTPISLSTEEARRLAEALNQAVSDLGGVPRAG
jgi:hypothetical protein